MEKSMAYESSLNLKATELRLGLPGSDESEEHTVRSNKRAAPEPSGDSNAGSSVSDGDRDGAPPPAKAQVVGWPPIRSYRRNSLQQSKKTETDVAGRLVKVSVDGAPYLRKIDLKVYGSYSKLLKSLEEMFKLTIGKFSEREGYDGSDYSPTYEQGWRLDACWRRTMGNVHMFLQEAEDHEVIRRKKKVL